MDKWLKNKLWLFLATSIVLTACATDTEETAVDTEEADGTEQVVESENSADDSASETDGLPVSFDIVIDGESVADLSKEITIAEGTYLMDAMHDTYDLTEEGGFISAIEGYEQDTDAGRYWLYYINDEMPSVGAADYELQAEDHIEWRLEDSE